MSPQDPNPNATPLEECSNCLFVRLMRGTELECHKDVPTVRFSSPSTSPRTMWPAVLSTDWCGQFVKLGP
jgi:hypothetical protein